MKLNIAYPATGAQKSIEIDDELKLHAFMDKRMGAEVDGDSLGPEFKGYVFRVTGGHDKEGFAMKQGVLVAGRVRLLLARGTTGFQAWRGRAGERKRKSVRGCIVGPDLSTLHLIVVKRGEAELPGITDKNIPKRLGPKRATKIRKLFNLTKEDDVRKFVIRRELPKKAGKAHKSKAPKIQRLVTPERLQRKRREEAQKVVRRHKRAQEAKSYANLLKQRLEQAKARRAHAVAQKRHSVLSHTPLTVEQRAAKRTAKAEALAKKAGKSVKKNVKKVAKKAGQKVAVKQVEKKVEAPKKVEKVVQKAPAKKAVEKKVEKKAAKKQ